MASILRSSKFVRYIAGFARNVVVNTPREFDGSLINTSQCLCGALQPNSFATQATVQHDQSLERSLKRIDQDVRKSGRISRRDIEDVLEEIRNARSATSSQSLLVIRCCGNLVPEELPEVRTKLVQEIWNTLNKLNIPMDISHYNALLRVYLENEHPFSPTEFLSELESKGIEPNRVTYQRLIARYCQQGDIEGATKILEFMREKQLPVNENVFNALIVGHSQTGDMDSAHGILGVMNQAGLEPTADTYTTLLAGYAKKGDIETIQKLFQECEEKEIFLLDKDYLDIVYALAINGHNEHVPAILTKVKKATGYNHDAVNLILRLTNKGQEETALLVLKSMVRNFTPEGVPLPTGGFFIKQLVKANRPIETIIKICMILEEEKMHETALLLATEFSLELSNESLAFGLLQEVKNRGYEIRQHFFWPLLLYKAKDKSGKGIVEVLLKMHEFGLQVSNETLREYVIPNLHMKSSDVISKLREANISVASATSSLIYNLLLKNEIQEAAVLASTVNAYFRPDLLRRPLTLAFIKTGDLDSYITILRNIHENVDRLSSFQTNEESENTVDKSEIIGNYIIELSKHSKTFIENIENILTRLVELGLSMSTTGAEKVQDKLGEKMTEEVSNLLGKLTSGELTPVPVVKKPPSYVPYQQMSIPQLERLIHNLEAKKQETKGLKRQLFTLYHRAKDIDKAEALLNSLKEDEFLYTPGLYAQLIDLHAYHDNLEKAEYYLQKLKAESTELVLDDGKILRLAQLYVKNNKFDEGIALLENVSREKEVDNSFNYTLMVWRFLNSLAEQGRVEDLEKLFDTLVKKEFIDVNNVILGPLIKVHLVNDDIIKALDKFEWCVTQFKTTPWKNELACKLIQNEDADNLQRLTDLSTSVHGEINSLYDLVFAFVECGRIRQARKILETPGLQNRPQRINNACERFQQEGMVKPLEGLKDATKDLNHIDRTDIYYQLLLSYIKQEDTDKALGLWTQMQEDDLGPTDQFLSTLGNFLQERGIEVPFAIPNKKQNQTPNVKIVRGPAQLFRQKIKNEDIDGALNIKQRSKEVLSIQDVSLLIEKCVQSNRLNDAIKLTVEALDNKTIPVLRVFKFLLNKLASNGDVDSLSSIGLKLDTETKKLVSFDNRLCHANLVAGKVEEYLNKLEKEIDSVDSSNASAVGDSFPRGGAYGILEKHPELLDKYEKIATKYCQKGVVAPINVLWTHYFIEGNHEKADELWNTQLKNAPRIMFQRIVQAAREAKNEDLIKKLIDHLKSSTVTEGAIGNAYSCYLDVLSSKDKQEEIIAVFENAVKDVNINHINRTAVLRVKEIYEKLGKPFTHTVPNKSVKYAALTSSSSSSDEGKNVKSSQN